MRELVIMIGCPGAGKTTYAKKNFEGYLRISQDDQGYEHHELFEKAIFEGKNIVVDRMGFVVEQRTRYTKPAVQLGYKIRYVWLDADFNTCFGRLLKRENHPTIELGDYQTMCRAVSGFFHNFEEPNSALEQFDQLDRIEVKDE